ncbi:MAG: hypothetical protein JXA54_12405 [Candidatus Heimdallarchaeota archaeon]|nr:hypothetical protein [Candidatus Heimdallarchaeota archaeon]
MSERILSFDIIRGWAILGNLMVHFFMLTSQVQGLAEAGNLEALNAFGFIQMGFIIIFGHWRGLFLLISASVHWYIMNKQLKAGVPRGIILRREILKGIVLWMWAMFFYIFLAEWSISKSLVETGTAQIEWWRIYHADQFANIAWAMMISAVIFFFLSKNEKLHKPFVGAIVFTVLGLLFVIPAPYVHQAANTLWGIDFQRGDHLSKLGEIGWWDYIVRLFTNQFVSLESPLMPHFAYSVVGSIIGIYISQEHKPNKRKFLSWGYSIAGLNIIFGVFWFLVIDKALTLPTDELINMTANFHVHPTWYVFVTIGLLLIVVLTVFAAIEFNRKLNVQRHLRISRLSRRAGVMSLTVYSLASIQAFLRVGMWGIFKLFGSPKADMFRSSFGLPSHWVFFMLAVELGLWFLILWLWEKVRFIGSVDWLLVAILKAPTKMKKDRKWLLNDPLDIQGKLIDPIPIRWVETPIYSFDSPITDDKTKIAETTTNIANATNINP